MKQTIDDLFTKTVHESLVKSGLTLEEVTAFATKLQMKILRKYVSNKQL